MLYCILDLCLTADSRSINEGVCAVLIGYYCVYGIARSAGDVRDDKSLFADYAVFI